MALPPLWDNRYPHGFGIHDLGVYRHSDISVTIMAQVDGLEPSTDLGWLPFQVVIEEAALPLSYTSIWCRQMDVTHPPRPRRLIRTIRSRRSTLSFDSMARVVGLEPTTSP